MKNIAFTLCSNNYIAQASLLVTSFVKENPDFEFCIGLVDETDERINYPAGDNITILPCKEVVPAELLRDMARRYKIVELNTSVKPFYFNYFFANNHDCKVVYLDPDLYVYNNFSSIVNLLNDYDFLITPHILSPIPIDGEFPSERLFMKYGAYNFGFLAMRKSEETLFFTNWWMERLSLYCYSEIQLGVFVDQSWATYLPVFCKGVYISKDPGWNAAFWNLHERNFESKAGKYFVNGSYPLLFFHFSSFNLGDTNLITKRKVRYTVQQRPDLKKIVEDYANEFKEAKKEYPSGIPCVYMNRTIKEKLFYYWNRYKIRKTLKE